MNNDRELLELAAKAAGYEITASGVIGTSILVYDEQKKTLVWSPLTDDGDALRLAVKLKISVLYEFDRVIVCYGDDDYEYETEFLYDKPEPTDPYAATRRAIVRAAAEIGKGMK